MSDFSMKTVLDWAKTELKFAQRDFTKSPNATRWNLATRAMFVYQQADYATRSACVDRKQLLIDLMDKPYGAWADIISNATTGKTVRKNLQEYVPYF